jgi:tRNA threonylcarbamoyladenosine biosynthesis protein TsaE
MPYMSIGTTWQIESSSSEDTFAIGEHLGRQCKGGEVFVLTSDLGGGKTTLTKGLAAGLGCNEIVSSPTFTISRIYTCKNNLKLYHFDFYRLSEPGVVAYELSEIINEPNIVVALEWGEIVNDVLPDRSIIVQLDRSHESEGHRNISIRLPNEALYLKESSS